jgi:4-hydroxythreonine-4-phosphate dehydrogenase
MNTKPVLGLTMGDPAGIGPEICLRALRHAAVRARCVPVLFGDVSVLQSVKKSCIASAAKTKGNSGGRTGQGMGGDCRVVTLEEFASLGRIAGPLIVDCATVDGARLKPGKISAACGRAAYVYIESAIAAALARKIDGVVTAPIHKEAFHLAGVKFPGHTEVFTALTGAKRSCMMLYSSPLTVSMVTTHIGYRDVPGKISADRILNVIELTAEAMRRILRREPRLGVCGLNPHAGEHGLFGRREEEIFVRPAIRRALDRGIRVAGPLVPDAAFTANVRQQFDAIVTLYHDQGHIPFKLLAFDTGVNVTLGLPIIRTSVDHGTAFDIAWQGLASPQSLISAFGVAADMAQAENAGARIPNNADARNGRQPSIRRPHRHPAKGDKP